MTDSSRSGRVPGAATVALCFVPLLTCASTLLGTVPGIPDFARGVIVGLTIGAALALCLLLGRSIARDCAQRDRRRLERIDPLGDLPRSDGR